MIGAGLDMVCCGITNTLLAFLDAHDGFPLHLAAPALSLSAPSLPRGEDLPALVSSLALAFIAHSM